MSPTQTAAGTVPDAAEVGLAADAAARRAYALQQETEARRGDAYRESLEHLARAAVGDWSVLEAMHVRFSGPGVDPLEQGIMDVKARLASIAAMAVLEAEGVGESAPVREPGLMIPGDGLFQALAVVASRLRNDYRLSDARRLERQPQNGGGET